MNESVNSPLINRIWEKGRIVEGLDPSMFRKDACGALIMRDKFGKKNPFGWEIDHIYPKSLGGGEDLINLRPLHYLNNRNKSIDYPSYTSCIRYDGNDNVEEYHNLTVNKKVRDQLRNIYPGA